MLRITRIVVSKCILISCDFRLDFIFIYNYISARTSLLKIVYYVTPLYQLENPFEALYQFASAALFLYFFLLASIDL